ncbi:hypothetical protein H6G00_10985 [Leptolyngbya sp. FACHB-541]|nr:hypothetical protein [Leptolyngbya sp. FACHB-541]
MAVSTKAWSSTAPCPYDSDRFPQDDWQLFKSMPQKPFSPKLASIESEALLLSNKIMMMTRGPAAQIAKILDVSFPYPRHCEALDQHPAYH